MNEIRTIDYLASNKGFTVTDIDSSIYNYQTGKFCMLELKCRKVMPNDAQTKHLMNLNKILSTSPLFQGIYCLSQKGVNLNEDSYLYKLVDGIWNRIWNKQEDAMGFEFAKDDVFRFVERLLT